jgi:peptide-methionine (S)-S-oxide reductase
MKTKHNTILLSISGWAFFTLFTCCSSTTASKKDINTSNKSIVMTDTNSSTALATFGSGCFWCTEAVFLELKGVNKVTSGYSGGKTKNPTYKEVCSGLSGHAEVIQIEYDPSQVDFETLLAVFWKTHDPTTLNRQGYDEGTQYRSVIFYHTVEQQKLALEYKSKLDSSGAYSSKIVTEISEFSIFYPAEKEHLNFYNLNPEYGYCRAVIAPKLDKFRKVFGDKLK